MPITIQIRRIIPSHKRALAIPLLDQVRELIRHQNGHFYTEVLGMPEVSEICIENSTWSSMAAWRNWEASREWQKAQARIEEMLETKTEVRVVAAVGC
jgi:heme-degrading monooxygenase HmoA